MTVIIVSWNSREYTLRSVASILDRPSRCGVEVVVVDNASTDGTQAQLGERFPQAQLIQNTGNVGFGRANSQGMAVARGRYLLLLNSDAFMDAGALDVLVDYLNAHERVACASPRLRYPDGRLQPSCYMFPTLASEVLAMFWLDKIFLRRPVADPYHMDRWDMSAPREVDSVMGACMLIRREALGSEPLFDPRFFMYSEEVDLCFRLHKRGYSIVFVPAAEAEHVWGGSAKQVDGVFLKRFYGSRVLFVRKHYGGFAGAVFKAAVALGSALRVGIGALMYLLRRDPDILVRQSKYRAFLREVPAL